MSPTAGLPIRFQLRSGRRPSRNPTLLPILRRQFVAGGTCHKIWDVGPVAKTTSVWLANLPEPQQMTLSEDGQMLFVTQATNPGDVLGMGVMTKATIFDYAALNPTSPLNQPTGVAIGSGALERDLFVNCGDGTVWQIDRGDATATEIAAGGTHGRAARCSINNSLLLAQTDRIMRLTAPAWGDSGFGYNSPYNFTAVAVNVSQIALYWDGVPGAIGYNIYRAYSPGAEDYGALPENGATPWTQHSYVGGNNYRFVDAGLQSTFQYWYTVKAVFPEGMSVPSEEDSDVPDPNAIPWNSNDPAVVTAALRSAYSDGQVVLADDLQAESPDGRVYSQTSGESGPTTILPAPGTWLRYTDQFRYPSGAYATLPNDPDTSMTQSAPRHGNRATIQNLSGGTGSLAASDGPYRRVTITTGGNQYAGVKGVFYLPDSAHYYRSPTAPNDTPDLYFGSSAQGIDVDAGLTQLQSSPGHDHSQSWTAFMTLKLNGKKQDIHRFFPHFNFDFEGGATVRVIYLARPSVQFPLVCKISPVLSVFDPTGPKVMTLFSQPAYKAGPISLRRVYSIAQGAPYCYRKTGSYLFGAQFSAGYAIQYGEENNLWDFGMTLGSQTGSYPASSGVIAWYEYGLYYEDDYININLQP